MFLFNIRVESLLQPDGGQRFGTHAVVNFVHLRLFGQVADHQTRRLDLEVD